MNKKIPTLSIKDLALLKSNPKKYYMKKLEEDITILDEETSTVKHPVTERARNIGATAKKGEKYRSGGKDCYDITYRDGTKLTYEIEEEGEYKKVGTERRTLYIPTDDDIEDSAEMAEPFAITDTLEERIFEQYPELEDNWEITDEPEFDGEGWEVPVSVDVYEQVEGKENLVSVTTPDGETIEYLEDKGGQGWHENVTLEMTPELKEAIEDLENGYPLPWNDRTEDAIYNQYGYEDVASGELVDYDDNTVTVDARFTKTDINKENKGSEVEKLSGADKTLYKEMTAEYRKNGIDGVKNKFSPEEIENYTNIVANNNLGKDASFFTIQNMAKLPDGEGVGKAIVQNKDFNSEHLTTDINDVMKEKGDGWTIITLREKGNPANNGIGIGDGTFVTAPGQKSERYLIDEERKTIIQRPYQPGMDRHIWG